MSDEPTPAVVGRAGIKPVEMPNVGKVIALRQIGEQTYLATEGGVFVYDWSAEHWNPLDPSLLPPESNG